MLVPTIRSTGTWYSSSTLRTPMWALPRAPPPERTSTTLGRAAFRPSACCAGAAVVRRLAAVRTVTAVRFIAPPGRDHEDAQHTVIFLTLLPDGFYNPAH